MKKTVFTAAVTTGEGAAQKTTMYTMEVNSPQPLTFDQVNKFCTMLSVTWGVDKRLIVFSQ